MSIAAAIISGLIGVGTEVVSGSMQSREIEKGRRESKEMYLGEFEEAKRARISKEKLEKRKIREGRRQFDVSTKLKERELGMYQEQEAHTRFRDQVSRLTQVVNKNAQLENLFINRLAGLRG